MIALFGAFWILILLLAILDVIGGVYKEKYWGAMSSIYDHPTKCFSCEKDAIRRFGPEMGWLGQNTKCFSCERDMIARTGSLGAAIDTHPIKYY